MHHLQVLPHLLAFLSMFNHLAVYQLCSGDHLCDGPGHDPRKVVAGVALARRSVPADPVPLDKEVEGGIEALDLAVKFVSLLLVHLAHHAAVVDDARVALQAVLVALDALWVVMGVSFSVG
jgi:hypothetical protein